MPAHALASHPVVVPLLFLVLLLSTPIAAAEWRYEVRETVPGHLLVNAWLPGGTGVHTVGGMTSFVQAVRVVRPSDETPVVMRNEQWLLPKCDPLCHVRWSFDLEGAAAASRDINFAREEGETILSPPGSWLLRPDQMPDGVRLRVMPAPGREFVTGMQRDGEDYRSDQFPVDVYAAFGAMATESIEVSGSELCVAVIRSGSSIELARLRRWIGRAVEANRTYYGALVEPRILILVRVFHGKGIHGGSAIGGGGAAVAITLGDQTTEAEFDADWELTHELVHLTFPTMRRAHHWIEEGIATYVEPVARVQSGIYPAGRLWRDLWEGLPKGQPGLGDQGLDRTHTWGRTYWGGALFCFVADIEIRKASGNRYGLQDALRAITRRGGRIDVEWGLEDTLAIGDAATGTHVLLALYRSMRESPHPVDLSTLFAYLGVSKGPSGTVVFDDRAAGAPIRRAIEEGNRQK